MSFDHSGRRDAPNPISAKLRDLFPAKASELESLEKRFADERAGKAPREYPSGRVSADDEGSLAFKIGTDAEKGIVVIEYSHETVWVGMQPQQAVELAQALIKHARSIAKEPLTVVLH